jgi:tRNA uridine 5-carboxymethylaminomethyl modification enzyme
MPQVSCHITHTIPTTHAVLRTGFEHSPIFTGAIAGRGPRYCPSIEDKLVRFSDRQQHQLFIEPDGLDSDLIYLNGFSTSLPKEVQKAALATIPGLERALIARPGYAVEYEAVPAYQLEPTLQSRMVQGLFLAGQVCGTSGYEEAAALGLMAGINAACFVQGRKPFMLSRSEAYIGVMIDDLTTKEWQEPYRMFTSRAEHRLVLRQDNAERRLTHYGHRLGLVDDQHFQLVSTRSQAADTALRCLEVGRIKPQDVEQLLFSAGTAPITAPVSPASLARRPRVPFTDLVVAAEASGVSGLGELLRDSRMCEQVAIEIRYEGYIQRELQLIARLRDQEEMHIPTIFDYGAVRALSAEAKEKLSRIRPVSIAQASRVAGVTPADLNVLRVALHR